MDGDASTAAATEPDVTSIWT